MKISTLLPLALFLLSGFTNAQNCNYEGPLSNFYSENSEGELKPRYYCVWTYVVSKYSCSNSNTEGCIRPETETRTVNEARNFYQTATYQKNGKTLTAIETYSKLIIFEQDGEKYNIPLVVGLFKDPAKHNYYFYELSDKPEHQYTNESFRFGLYDGKSKTTFYGQKGIIEIAYHRYGEPGTLEKVEFFDPTVSTSEPYKINNYGDDGVLIESIDYNKETITYYSYSEDSDEEGFVVFGNFKPYTRSYLNETAVGSYKVYYPNGDLRLDFEELPSGQNTYKAYYLDGSIESEKVQINQNEYRETNYAKDRSIVKEHFEDANGSHIKYSKEMVKPDEFEALVIENISFDFEYEYFDDNVTEIMRLINYDAPDVPNEKIEFFYPDGSNFGYYHKANSDLFGEYKLYYPNGVVCNEGVYIEELHFFV